MPVIVSQTIKYGLIYAIALWVARFVVFTKRKGYRL